MILPRQEMLDLTGESYSQDLDFVHRAVEKEIKNYCNWEIESATYTNLLLDGSGRRWQDVGLKNITSLARVSTGLISAIKIKHSTASSNAYAKVNYTDNAPISLGLVVADGSDSGSSTDLFATYTTLTTLVAQINANANDWSAQLDDADLGVFASTNLIEVQNLYAGTFDGTDPGWTELMMPGQPIREYELHAEQGSLYLNGGWPKGVRNIPVTLTAGWTTANMPYDIKQAVSKSIKFIFTRHQQDISAGIQEFDLGHLRIKYGEEMAESGASSIPIEVLDVLDADYKVQAML